MRHYRASIVIPGEPSTAKTIIIEATSDVNAWEKAAAACKFHPMLGQEEVKSVYRSEVVQQTNWVKIINPHADKVNND
jgi:hypothetical protein